jgi:capsular polysaccharide biosynthesis protein
VEIQEYFKVLWKRGWIIVLIAVITAASAYGFSEMQTPVYKGVSKLHFRPYRADWGLTNVAKEWLPLYRERIQSDLLLRDVIGRLQLDFNPDALKSKIATAADQATFSIQIEARDHDPVIATRIAETLAQVFKEDQDEFNQLQDKQDRLEVSILNDARQYLFSPRKKINTLAGGIFGVMVGVVIAFFLEWLESDVVRTTEDVERHVGVPVLGSIPVITSGEVVPVGARRKRSWSFLRSFNLSTILVFGAGFLSGAVIVGLALTAL